MTVAAQIVVGLVAALHFVILVLEMFLWRTDRVRAIFGTTREFAEQTAIMAANQGLYNGFLAAGLGYGLGTGDLTFQVFFLLCVAVAGIYGAVTVTHRILFVQVIPAALGLLLVLVAA